MFWKQNKTKREKERESLNFNLKQFKSIVWATNIRRERDIDFLLTLIQLLSMPVLNPRVYIYVYIYLYDSFKF